MNCTGVYFFNLYKKMARRMRFGAEFVPLFFKGRLEEKEIG